MQVGWLGGWFLDGVAHGWQSCAAELEVQERAACGLQESVATRACAAVDARRARDWHGSLRDEVCILCGITARRHSTPCIPRGFDPQLPQPAILRVIGQETSSCRTCLVKAGCASA